MPRSAFLVALLLVVSIPTPARAQPWMVPSTSSPESSPKSGPANASAKKSDTRWYGYQVFALDLGVMALAGKLERPGVMAVGMMTVTPLIHLANGEPRRAKVSLLVRGLAVGIETFMYFDCKGDAWDSEGSEDCDTISLGVGMMTALPVVIIESLLSSKEIPVRAKPKQHARLVPFLAPLQGGATAGIGGFF